MILAPLSFKNFTVGKIPVDIIKECNLNMAIQQTFLMVKPDGVKRQVVGDIVDRFERRGFELKGAKLMNITKELAEKQPQSTLEFLEIKGVGQNKLEKYGAAFLALLKHEK